MTIACMNTSAVIGRDLHVALAEACARVGIEYKDVPQDGRWHRSDVLGDRKGKGDASIKLFSDGKGGMVRNWKGEDRLFFADAGQKLSEAELTERQWMAERFKAEAAAERAKMAEEAAAKCVDLWNRAGNVDVGHPYVERKGIKPVGAKQWGDALLIPLWDAGGKLRSLQFIQPGGFKRFKSGGAVTGCYSVLGDKPGPDAPLLICEGWATACSLHEATGYPVAAAMNAGNMLAVAQALRAEMPNVPMIVCADDDIETSGNPGLTNAQEAARAIGAQLAVPNFGQVRPEGATDFNDLAVAGGHCAVRDCIEAVWCGKVAENAADKSPVAETDEQAIARMAVLSLMEYDRVRKVEAERMGVQLATLDLMVKKARGDATREAAPFEDVEPWGEPVDGAVLLSEIARTIRRFVICDPESTAATALWCMAAWLVDHVNVCPILLINAPEKACGKTQLLTLVGKLVPRPAQAAGISSSVLFRLIEKYRPTLLVDEIETVLTKEAEDLRGLMNAGHTRESAFVWRTNTAPGADFAPQRFSVFGFKAIAGINADKLAETITSRAVVVQMRRKMPHETAERLRYAEPDLFDVLRAKLARWANDGAATIHVARPSLPDVLSDRDQDNWEPLLAVADLAAGTWPAYARSTAIKLCKGDAAQSTGAELLADIKAVFDQKKVQRISMTELLAALCEDDEAPWKTWSHGKEMTARQLGKKLRDYGIESQTLKIAYQTSKGYKVEQFEDVFARYLPASQDSPVSSVAWLQPNAEAGFWVTGAQLPGKAENALVTQKPASGKEGNRVTEKEGVTQKEEGAGESVAPVGCDSDDAAEV